jgi:hypothetical protein
LSGPQNADNNGMMTNPSTENREPTSGVMRISNADYLESTKSENFDVRL